MGDAVHHGWLVWHDASRGASSSWVKVFAVLTTESLSWFRDTDSDDPLGEIEFEATSQLLGDLRAEGLGFDLPEHARSREHAFVVLEQDSGEPACFAAEDEENQQAWVEALREVLAMPRQLEAHIDDLSDYEDDYHAKRSSLEMMEGFDWCTASGNHLPAVASAPSKGARSRRSVKDASVAQAKMDGSDDEEAEPLEQGAAKPKSTTNKRSSLEMMHTVDWNMFSMEAKGTEEAPPAGVQPAAEDISGGAGCATIAPKESAPAAPTDAFQAAYGECW